MFDTQKISFDNFALGYKHGVYVFVKDACDWCKRYKQEIEYINNHYLFIVEVMTAKQEELLNKILGRETVFPITVGYVDNVIKFAKTGVQWEEQQAKEILPFLKQFGNVPLSEAEIERRIEKQKNRCMLTYYVFPSNATDEERAEWINEKAAAFNELPIDVSCVGVSLPNDERERMLESQYASAKMVVFKKGEHSTLAPFENKIMLGYAIANQEVKFITRDISVNPDK